MRRRIWLNACPHHHNLSPRPSIACLVPHVAIPLSFSHLVVRAHLVGELHSLDANLSAEPVVVDVQPAVDIDVRQGVHEAEHSLRRARRPRQAISVSATPEKNGSGELCKSSTNQSCGVTASTCVPPRTGVVLSLIHI